MRKRFYLQDGFNTKTRRVGTLGFQFKKPERVAPPRKIPADRSGAESSSLSSTKRRYGEVGHFAGLFSCSRNKLSSKVLVSSEQRTSLQHDVSAVRLVKRSASLLKTQQLASESIPSAGHKSIGILGRFPDSSSKSTDSPRANETDQKHFSAAELVSKQQKVDWEKTFWRAELRSRDISALFELKNLEHFLIGMVTGRPPQNMKDLRLEV